MTTETLTAAPDEVRDDLHGRYLTFYIGDTLYGIELMHVIEIISVQPTTRVPGLPPYIKGLINLRGKVVPVIDIRLKFHQEERPYDDKTCIIVVTIDDMNVGLIADAVAEVADIDQSLTSPPPELGTADGERYLRSVAKVGDRVILNIDIQRFFRSDLG